MHELAIAESIAELATEHARGHRVRAVRVRIGAFRQVVPSALTFGFEVVTKDTPLDGARLHIEEVPVAGRCRACGRESPQPRLPLRCPCGNLALDVIRGEELEVESLELEVASAPASSAAPPSPSETEPERSLS